MGLARSLYTGWTGLATHQRSLDNTGNNLANANTVGFKSSQFQFANLLTQAYASSSPSDGVRGSVGPLSVGAGVTTGAITADFRTGPLESTGNALDAAISGKGFFMVSTTAGPALTRNGAFYLDHAISPGERTLCAGDGLPVQGWMAANGAISPAQAPGDIRLPALGDLLPGQVTTSATIEGIAPPAAEGGDFSGTSTRSLELKGNLAGDGANAIRTTIHAPVTRSESGTDAVSREIQALTVEIVFAGPSVSPDGSLTTWNWSMHTVDWPRAGDPPVPIYPPDGAQDYPQGTLRFYGAAAPSLNRGAGQIFEPQRLSPGSASVQSTVPLPDGGDLTASLAIDGSFTMDFTRLTAMADPHPGAGLTAWYVDGNAAGSMARPVTVYDEVTRFEQVAAADGTAYMRAVRRVEARQVLLQFSKTAADNSGSSWRWTSSLDGAGGELGFDTVGDLVSQTSGGGRIAYDFSGLHSIAASASLTLTGQDGYPDGYLESLSLDQFGKIFGRYSNGVAEPLAQIAVATVPNATGLAGAGGTLFYATPSSGAIVVGRAGDADYADGVIPSIGAGMLVPQHLEGSNVDLSVEFTTLIATERGYQANARVVTTSDEMLQELVAMKR